MTLRKYIILAIITIISIGCQFDNLTCFKLYVEKSGEITSNPDTIFEFQFKNGRFKSKNIYRVLQNNDFEFGYNEQIHQNRYIINGFGDIYDIDKNQQIFENKNPRSIYEITGDSIFYKFQYSFYEIMDIHHSNLNYSITPTYSIYNLKSNTFEFIKDSIRYNKRGILSPDKKSSVFFEPKEYIGLYIDTINPERKYFDRTIKGDIYLHHRNENPIKIFSNATVSVSSYSSNRISNFPVFWIDNDSFIFQISNNKIAISNLNGEYKVFTPIKNSKLCFYPPVFRKNHKGEILFFSLTNETISHKVDIETMSLIPTGRYQKQIIKSNFYVQYGDYGDNSSLYIDDFLIYSSNKEIHFKCSEKLIAFINNETENERNKRIDIWNNKKEKVATLKLSKREYIVALIDEI